ncbi:hypothetical protein FRB95_001820 [Tulasnella sp. JGI-2019a]|nr:hypothetical protein FRB95_001820 [Tulasnella sp. JGI-2019a]
MAGMPLGAANYFGLIVSVWIYAVFLNMFLSSIRPLWNRRLHPGGKFVLGAMCYLFISATANIAINIATGRSQASGFVCSGSGLQNRP